MVNPANAIQGASLSDILTAIKNLVTAVNGATQAYLQVNGTSIQSAILTPTVVKASGGRVVNVAVVTTNGSVGGIYDSGVLGLVTRPLFEVPGAVGLYQLNLPVAYGILAVPGASMELAVSYS